MSTKEKVSKEEKIAKIINEKDVQVGFRVSLVFKQKIEFAAKRENLKKSDFIRKTLEDKILERSINHHQIYKKFLNMLIKHRGGQDWLEQQMKHLGPKITKEQNEKLEDLVMGYIKNKEKKN